MRYLFRLFTSLVDDAEFWLPLAGLVLIGAGMAMTLLHVFGYAR
jgi:hypothetical protein